MIIQRIGTLFVFLLIFVCALAGESRATWKPEYAQLPQSVRDWYAHAEINPEALPRLKERFHYVFTRCCDQSEVVKTQFRVDKTTGSDQWWFKNERGDWEPISNDIVHPDEHAPDNQPTLFIYQGVPTCFFPPGGGL